MVRRLETQQVVDTRHVKHKAESARTLDRSSATIRQTLMRHSVPINIPYIDDDYKSLHFCPRFDETFSMQHA
jgi:hypothetical protein